MKTKTFITIGSAVALIILLYLSCSVRINHYKHLRKHGKKTVGTVGDVGIKTYDISIDVAGRSYKGTKGIPDASFFATEQYEVVYDENDPKDLAVVLSAPVIDLHTYDFDTTLPTEVRKAWLSQGTAIFWYVINGQEYRRTQSVEDTDYWTNSQNVSVVYRVDRPEIGYLVKKN